jgi:carbamoyl-phosphate synthase small subunit
MHNNPAILVLADGTIYPGFSIGAEGEAVGELVFNTAMTGYQEILTDPSYAKQVVMLTTAHVGNTGCNTVDLESNTIWAEGLVVRDCPSEYSNYRAKESLSTFLKRHNVVAIAGLDTRMITHRLRDFGSLSACISTHVNEPAIAQTLAKDFSGLQGVDLAQAVSRQTPERWYEGLGAFGKESLALQYQVVAYDFGIKHNILRILYDKGCHITIVPAKTPAKEILAMQPDGVLLSNGPGDPEACDYAIDATKIFLQENLPLFGICLGFQILALASGAKTVKMKFGHHGANHPVKEIGGNSVFITSQNHNFMVDEASLPEDLTVTHRSLFDNSLQGIRHKTKLAFGFQGHPEASPGPHDLDPLFNTFIQMMEIHKNMRIQKGEDPGFQSRQAQDNPLLEEKQ